MKKLGYGFVKGQKVKFTTPTGIERKGVLVSLHNDYFTVKTRKKYRKIYKSNIERTC